MSAPVIMDIVILGFILLGVYIGAKRGLFRALAGIVILVAALIGAGETAQRLYQPVNDFLQPIVAEKIESRIAEGMERVDLLPDGAEALLPEVLQSQHAEQLLEKLGFGEDQCKALLERVEEVVETTGANVATAIAAELTENFIYSMLYLVSFLLLLVVLHLLKRVIQLILKLPVLRGANAFGGALVGLLESLVLLNAAVYLAPKIGAMPSQELVSQTKLLQFLVQHSFF